MAQISFEELLAVCRAEATEQGTILPEVVRAFLSSDILKTEADELISRVLAELRSEGLLVAQGEVEELGGDENETGAGNGQTEHAVATAAAEADFDLQASAQLAAEFEKEEYRGRGRGLQTKHHVPSYIQALVQLRALDPEHERALTRKAVGGDTAAAITLWRHNARFILWMALRMVSYTRNLGVADLFQEGSLGFFQELPRVDPERGVKLMTYLGWWVRHYISRAIANQDRVVRFPGHVLARRNRVGKAARALGQAGQEVTVAVLAEKTGLSEEQVQQAQLASAPEVSLSTPTSEDGEQTLEGLLASTVPLPYTGLGNLDSIFQEKRWIR